METSQTGTPDNGQHVESLNESLQGLRTLVHVVVMAMIILSGSLAVYLWKQTGIVRKQVAEMDKYVNEYNTQTRPKMEEFVSRLQQFSKSNPDFSPILSRYNLGTGPAATSDAPAVPNPGAPKGR